MDTLDPNSIIPSRPEEIIPMESQQAAAPKRILKRTSLAISPIKSRRPITPDGKFKCTAPGCNFTTNYESNLERHAERHYGKREGSSRMPKSTKLTPRNTRSLSRPMSELFNCNRCSYSTAYKCNLKRHFATHPNYPTFGCHYCEYRSPWKFNVTTHEKRKHAGVTRMISGKMKTGKVRVMNGMKTKKDQPSKCQMNTSTTVNKLVSSREGRFHCKGCDYMSNNKILFVSHVMKCHSDEEQIFPCTFPGCSYRSEWSQWTTAHERSAHSSTCSQSKTQNKSAQASSKLKSSNAQFVKVVQRPPSKTIPTSSRSAKNTPTKEGASKKKVKCPNCECQFDRRYLQLHLRVHSAEKPFGCSVNGCDYRTRWPNDLKYHMVRHGKVAKKSTPRVTEKSSCRQGKGGNVAIATSGIENRFATPDGRNLVKPKSTCHSAGSAPRLSTRSTRKLNSDDKGYRFCDCTNQISSARKNAKGKKPTVVLDEPEVEKEPSMVNGDDNDEETKENNEEAYSMEPVEQAASAEFACMLCDFVGYTEAAAWDHAKCHRQPLRPSDNLEEIPVILLD